MHIYLKAIKVINTSKTSVIITMLYCQAIWHTDSRSVVYKQFIAVLSIKEYHACIIRSTCISFYYTCLKYYIIFMSLCMKHDLKRVCLTCLQCVYLISFSEWLLFCFILSHCLMTLLNFQIKWSFIKFIIIIAVIFLLF